MYNSEINKGIYHTLTEEVRMNDKPQVYSVRFYNDSKTLYYK